MSGFIPSPFRAVTEYENELIRLWRKNTAKGLAKLVKAIENGNTKKSTGR